MSDPKVVVAVLAEKHITGAEPLTLGATPEGSIGGVRVPGRLAFAAWTALREAVPRTGCWPVVIGAEGQLPWLEDNAGPVADILASAAKLDLAAWVREELEFEPERFQAAGADWPGEVQHQETFQVLDLLKQRALSAVIALVPTTQPHEVPAHLRFGGWNNCPDPVVHTATFRDWHQRFGAEPVVMAGDTVEFLVRRPVSSRAEALELARFQYVYCSDIVEQGVESVEALAATLLGDPRWFFWWD